MRRCARGERCARAELVEYDQCTGDCDCHLGPYHPCSIAGGCGHLHAVARSHLGALIEHGHDLCPTCMLVIVDAIGELPADYVSLRIAQYRGITSATSELVMATKDLPIPISLTFALLADQIEIETTAFAEPVAEKLNIDWDKSITPKAIGRYGAPPKYTGPVVLDKAARLLVNAVDVLVDLPVWVYRLWGEDGWAEVEASGVEAALTLLALHQATRATLGLTRASTTMQAECPWCKTQTLVQASGDDCIKCQLCLRRYTPTEYEQWSLVLINSHPKPSKKPRRRVRTDKQEIRSSTEGTVGRPKEMMG